MKMETQTKLNHFPMKRSPKLWAFLLINTIGRNGRRSNFKRAIAGCTKWQSVGMSVGLFCGPGLKDLAFLKWPIKKGDNVCDTLSHKHTHTYPRSHSQTTKIRKNKIGEKHAR